MEARELVGHQPVELLGERVGEIEGAQSRLDVSEGDAAVVTSQGRA